MTISTKYYCDEEWLRRTLYLSGMVLDHTFKLLHYKLTNGTLWGCTGTHHLLKSHTTQKQT